MSKFCSFCGKELIDGQCTCEEFVNAQVVEEEGKPYKPMSFNSIWQELLGALKNIGKSRKEAAKDLSLASTGIFAGAALVVFTISILLFMAGSQFIELFDSAFGTSLLLSLITVLYSVVVQSAIVVVCKLIKKEPMKFSANWFNLSAINIFTYSAIVLVGSLFSLFAFKFSLFFVLFASVSSIVDAINLMPKSDCTWKHAVKTGVVTLSTVIFISIFFKILTGGINLGFMNYLLF